MGGLSHESSQNILVNNVSTLLENEITAKISDHEISPKQSVTFGD